MSIPPILVQDIAALFCQLDLRPIRGWVTVAGSRGVIHINGRLSRAVRRATIARALLTGLQLRAGTRWSSEDCHDL
jgi:hypothetical protein